MMNLDRFLRHGYNYSFSSDTLKTLNDIDLISEIFLLVYLAK